MMMTLDHMRDALRHAPNAWVFDDSEGGLYSLHDIADAIDAEQQQRFECLVAVIDILDGKDTGVGVCNEPWQSVRMRLIELVKRQGWAVAEVYEEPGDWGKYPSSPRIRPIGELPPVGTKLYTAPPATAVPLEMPIKFGEWFCKNYPGPDTIISDPRWHAPRIWKAARHALLANAPSLVAKEPIHG